MSIACKRAEGRWAFSLVEVVLALAIVSFALISVIGLLPAGLVSVRHSQQQDLAAQTLNTIAACLQGASTATTSGKTFTALAPYNTAPALLTWTNGGAAQPGYTIYLDESGAPTDRSRAYYMALVHITPAQGLTPAYARIGVAWPVPGANVEWDGSNFQLTNQQGFIESVVYVYVR